MQLTTNTRAFIEAEQYSEFILLVLHDGLLPETFYRNVSDFGTGTNLHIKTVGVVTLQDAAEDAPLNYNPIETGEIQLQITQYKGDAWYVTDDLREDGTNIDMLMAQRAAESTRAFQENFETTMFNTVVAAYPTSGAYTINGFAHKIVSAATNNVLTLGHLIQLRLAFDKAQVPFDGRVAIVDPIVEATLNSLVTITSNMTQYAKDIINNGLARGQKFVEELYGWTIITSNRLYVGAANDGTTSLGSAVWNVFMCVSDDQTKPLMFAWRRMPKTEGERNKDRARDEFVTRARYGFGIQRMDTLAVLCTSPTNIS
jgi:hypothetical protein